MSRLLIDLTDLQAWAGNYIGIPRVVYGISRWFFENQAELQDEVKFINFNTEKKTFYYTDFETHQLRAGSDSYQKDLYKKKVHFSKKDTVLIMGMPWNNLARQTTLSQKKRWHRFKLVQVVYDMIISLQPQFQNPVLYDAYNTHMREVLRTSDLMLAISKFTAQDVDKFCHKEGISKPPIRVIRLGDDLEKTSKSVTNSKPDSRIKNNFIACVGTIEIRKNQTLLYYTYKLAAERGQDLPQLLIVGRRGWLSDDIQHLIDNDPQLKPKILILDSVNDEGLAWIYQHCLFTIYPSMYEGWGLPLAESLNYGKLCLSSRASSMPEIADDLVAYFSPFNSAECLEKILTYLDTKRRVQAETRIRKTYQPTTWDQTAKQVSMYLTQGNV